MLRWTSFISIVLFSFNLFAEIGFSGGNDRVSVLAKGDIILNCQDSMGGGANTIFYSCRSDLLDPAEFAYFNGPEGVTADEVTLSVTRENDSVREKTQKYVSSKKQSKKSFNLWINTLLQKALLDFGVNNVTYTLKSNGKVVNQGQFTANVRDGGVRECRHRGHYWSNLPNDCNNASTYCDRYFREENYCQ